MRLQHHHKNYFIYDKLQDSRENNSKFQNLITALKRKAHSLGLYLLKKKNTDDPSSLYNVFNTSIPFDFFTLSYTITEISLMWGFIGK